MGFPRARLGMWSSSRCLITETAVTENHRGYFGRGGRVLLAASLRETKRNGPAPLRETKRNGPARDQPAFETKRNGPAHEQPAFETKRRGKSRGLGLFRFVRTVVSFYLCLRLFLPPDEKKRANIAVAALPDTWLLKWAARVPATSNRQEPVLQTTYLATHIVLLLLVRPPASM